MLFKDSVVIPPNIWFLVISHNALDNALNGSYSTGRRGTATLNLKQCLVTLSIANNDNNAIAVGKAFNTLIKVIHEIEGDSNKVKIAPRKFNQPNLDVLHYIKGG